MQLETKRLSLTELSFADLEAIHQLHSLPETDKFNTLGIPENKQATEILLNEWIEKQKAIPRISYIFCIKNIETGQFIGLIALNIGKPNYRIAEVWYKLHAAHWRKGYATEALCEVLRFGFITLALHRIEAGCAVENAASIRVLEKAGMTREGRKRQILPIRGTWSDNYLYAILDTDPQQMTKPS